MDAAEARRMHTRIYSTLAIVSYIGVRVDDSYGARARIFDHVAEFAKSKSDLLRAMGFPAEWESLELWKGGYGRNAEIARRAALLRGLQLLPTGEAAAKLTHKPEPRSRPSRLKYYRKNGAVLSVPSLVAGMDGVATGGDHSTHRYPSFQFDAGDVVPVVIHANRKLLRGGKATEQDRWNAVQWWSQSAVALGGQSPLSALAQGRLTDAVVDTMLV